MPVYEIRHRWNNASVLFTLEAGSLRLTLEAAVRVRADLRAANLQGADLRAANLQDADLQGADLQDADLQGADLRAANLQDADLRAANLRGADLQDADLQGADLQGANLRAANLQGANLQDANLRAADLRAANLRAADLQGADLRAANLRPIRDDLWAVLCGAPAEVPALRAALIAGQIDGSSYVGDCACLVGTLAKARGCDIYGFANITPDSSRLIERWFANIQPGDTPEMSGVAAQTLQWVDTWTDNMTGAFGEPRDASPEARGLTP